MPIIRSASSTTTFDKGSLETSLLLASIPTLWPLLKKPCYQKPAIIDDLGRPKVAQFSELFYGMCDFSFKIFPSSVESWASRDTIRALAPQPLGFGRCYGWQDAKR
jgi:hypothetical protein